MIVFSILSPVLIEWHSVFSDWFSSYHNNESKKALDFQPTSLDLMNWMWSFPSQAESKWLCSFVGNAKTINPKAKLMVSRIRRIHLEAIQRAHTNKKKRNMTLCHSRNEINKCQIKCFCLIKRNGLAPLRRTVCLRSYLSTLFHFAKKCYRNDQFTAYSNIKTHISQLPLSDSWMKIREREKKLFTLRYKTHEWPTKRTSGAKATTTTTTKIRREKKM